MKRERTCTARHLEGKPPGYLLAVKQGKEHILVCNGHALKLRAGYNGPIRNKAVKRQKPGPLDAVQVDLVEAASGGRAIKASDAIRSEIPFSAPADMPPLEPWRTIHLNARGEYHGFYKFRGQGAALEVWKAGGGRMTDPQFLHNFRIIADFADALVAKDHEKGSPEVTERAKAHPSFSAPAEMPEVD